MELMAGRKLAHGRSPTSQFRLMNCAASAVVTMDEGYTPGEEREREREKGGKEDKKRKQERKGENKEGTAPREEMAANTDRN